MTDATSAAPEVIRSFVNRILRLKEDQAEIANDIRAVYGEAKAQGFDKTRLGEVVSYIAKRSVDASKVEEAEAIFDLYLRAYDGKSGTKDANIDRAHTHAPDGQTIRSALPDSPPEPSGDGLNQPAGSGSEEIPATIQNASEEPPLDAADLPEGANASGLYPENRVAETIPVVPATAEEARPAPADDVSSASHSETVDVEILDGHIAGNGKPSPAGGPTQAGEGVQLRDVRTEHSKTSDLAALQPPPFLNRGEDNTAPFMRTEIATRNIPLTGTVQ